MPKLADAQIEVQRAQNRLHLAQRETTRLTSLAMRAAAEEAAATEALEQAETVAREARKAESS